MEHAAGLGAADLDDVRRPDLRVLAEEIDAKIARPQLPRHPPGSRHRSDEGPARVPVLQMNVRRLDAPPKLRLEGVGEERSDRAEDGQPLRLRLRERRLWMSGGFDQEFFEPG